MAVSMPAVVVLIVCKVALVAGPPDQNSPYTHWENLQWDTPNAMMLCRRQEIQMFDQAEALGAQPQPFTPTACQRSGAMLLSQWDEGHQQSNYRAWRYACPTPIINTITGETIGYVLPDCGHPDTVVCESDTNI